MSKRLKIIVPGEEKSMTKRGKVKDEKRKKGKVTRDNVKIIN